MKTRFRQIQKQKQTKVCLTLDTNNPDKILGVVDKIGDNICAIKLHTDILVHESEKFAQGLHGYKRLVWLIICGLIGASLSLFSMYWFDIKLAHEIDNRILMSSYIAYIAIAVISIFPNVAHSKFSFIHNIQRLAKRHNFMIIEDAALCGNTDYVSCRIEQIAQYADFITVHAWQGESVIRNIVPLCIENNCRLLLIAQTSEHQDLKYADEVKALATRYSRVVAGFICTENLGDPAFLYFTPTLSDSCDAVMVDYRKN